MQLSPDIFTVVRENPCGCQYKLSIRPGPMFSLIRPCRIAELIVETNMDDVLEDHLCPE